MSAAVEAGELAVAVPEHVTVERPKNRDHGDYATNVALQLAKPAGMPPRAVADLLAARLRETTGVAKVDIAGPGFLNITLDAATQGLLARTVVEADQAYGRNEALKGLTINLEFVSANPTGPIHIGGVRWAAVGDSLARVLRATGADVTTEYYLNDAACRSPSSRGRCRPSPTASPSPRTATSASTSPTSPRRSPTACRACSTCPRTSSSGSSGPRASR
ncbi:hypothetical protein ACFQ1I_28815 [Kitasatospora arboriphila]